MILKPTPWDQVALCKTARGMQFPDQWVRLLPGKVGRQRSIEPGLPVVEGRRA